MRPRVFGPPTATRCRAAGVGDEVAAEHHSRAITADPEPGVCRAARRHLGCRPGPATGGGCSSLLERTAARAERLVQGRDEVVGGPDPGSARAGGLRVPDEVGVAERETEVDETVHGLLPADHPVGVVLQDEDDQVEPEPHGRLQLLGVHHEAPVAADGEHPSTRCTSEAVIADGSPAPMVASALSSSRVFDRGER